MSEEKPTQEAVDLVRRIRHYDTEEVAALALDTFRKAQLASMKTDYENACKLVAEMHAAAVGEVRGPDRGVVEDIADLKDDRDGMAQDWLSLRAQLAETEDHLHNAGVDIMHNAKMWNDERKRSSSLQAKLDAVRVEVAREAWDRAIETVFDHPEPEYVSELAVKDRRDAHLDELENASANEAGEDD